MLRPNRCRSLGEEVRQREEEPRFLVCWSRRRRYRRCQGRRRRNCHHFHLHFLLLHQPATSSNHSRAPILLPATRTTEASSAAIRPEKTGRDPNRASARDGTSRRARASLRPQLRSTDRAPAGPRLYRNATSKRAGKQRRPPTSSRDVRWYRARTRRRQRPRAPPPRTGPS